MLLDISPLLLVVLPVVLLAVLLVVPLLPSEYSLFHDVSWARSNVIYICTSYICLYTGDSTTPLLSAQRVSPLRS